MPLVERYDDWKITDGSFDDPHVLEFDHRIEADAAISRTGLAHVENNAKATCVVTILKPEFGWTQVENVWSCDPTQGKTNLQSIWRSNLAGCVQHDKESLRDCFCNNRKHPATAYVGPEADTLPDKINALEWPRNTTELVSRFAPASQYMIGPRFCSAYHLGDGYVGTAGHCFDRESQLDELRVVFNWVGDVVGKKTFTASEVFPIERVVLCDTHGASPSPTDPAEIAYWSRRWDSAILKLKATPYQLSHLKSAKYALRPSRFGSSIYNIGCPLGTQLKVSANGHVLRHPLVENEDDPFSHLIAGYGTFTTDLDQFEGNSGGPVFDANTGYIVGHTSSTQDAVAESDAAAIESWANDYARTSKNYALAAAINQLLEQQEPNNKYFRVHPKFLRTLSGKPGDSPVIKCATNVCPGDLGPNRAMQTAERYQAVFSRHLFDSKDVYLRNVTARVDRSAIFMTALGTLLNHNYACLLTLSFAGRADAFRMPDTGGNIIVTIGAANWDIQHPDFQPNTRSSIPSHLKMWSATIDLATHRHEIPAGCLDAPRGLIEMSKVRLTQPTHNSPSIVGVHLSVQRPTFPFPVNKTWPPEISDVTNNPQDAELMWPEETFEFATTAGDTLGASQTDGVPESPDEGNHGQFLWTWEAPINKVWTNPRQPSDLRDPLMDDIDELLA